MSADDNLPALKRRKLAAETALAESKARVAEATAKLRLEELANARNEKREPEWRNPLTVAIVGATLAGLVSILTTWLSGSAQLDLEDRKAEYQRILEALKTDGDADRAADNLEFLVEINLVKDEEVRFGLSDYLAGRSDGEGPSLSVGAVFSGSDRTGSAPQVLGYVPLQPVPVSALPVDLSGLQEGPEFGAVAAMSPQQIADGLPQAHSRVSLRRMAGRAGTYRVTLDYAQCTSLDAQTALSLAPDLSSSALPSGYSSVYVGCGVRVTAEVQMLDTSQDPSLGLAGLLAQAEAGYLTGVVSLQVFGVAVDPSTLPLPAGIESDVIRELIESVSEVRAELVGASAELKPMLFAVQY